MQVTPDQAGTLRRQLTRLFRTSNENADPESALEQTAAKPVPDKSGSAGNRDQARGRNQADTASLRRTSSEREPGRRFSRAAMKSRRAFARESLPDEVRGSE